MHYFRGSPALSAFRIEKLLNLLKKQLPQIQSLHTEFVHFADVQGELTTVEQQILQKLLTYGPAYTPEERVGTLFLVTPRTGTISPWSSKATDIAQNCGLNNITRLERGVAYYVKSASALTATDTAFITAKIHDRMTEIVLRDFAAVESLFLHTALAVGGSVDVLIGGLG